MGNVSNSYEDYYFDYLTCQDWNEGQTGSRREMAMALDLLGFKWMTGLHCL